MIKNSVSRQFVLVPALCAGLALPVAQVSFAAGTEPAIEVEPAAKPTVGTGDAIESDVAQYCRNTADAVAEARLAWQTWTLVALEDKLKLRLAELDKKKAEFEHWVERRVKILAEVEDQVVSIYARMRPDAAALQLATLGEDTAVAVLAKLKPRKAGEILNEMEPARAAQLTHAMSGLSRADDQEGS